MNKFVYWQSAARIMTKSRCTAVKIAAEWNREMLLYQWELDIYLDVSVINSVMTLVTAVLTLTHCKFQIVMYVGNKC